MGYKRVVRAGVVAWYRWVQGRAVVYMACEWININGKCSEGRCSGNMGSVMGMEVVFRCIISDYQVIQGVLVMLCCCYLWL